jgi:hypothetical protein
MQTGAWRHCLAHLRLLERLELLLQGQLVGGVPGLSLQQLLPLLAQVPLLGRQPGRTGGGGALLLRGFLQRRDPTSGTY